ncbi:MAG: hypothetical protein GY874_17270 [Desulfobacteraceae bacterium]|nr:hypothetical protein [Desulfobacteraceae bacterium]
MAFSLSQWRTIPVSAAIGVCFWAVSWLFFLVYTYFLTKDSDWVIRLAVAFVLLAVFICRANNWARMIALMSNSMAILFLGILAYAFRTGRPFDFLIVLSILTFFGISTWYLAVASTSDFFKLHSPKFLRETDNAKDNDNSPKRN